MKVNAGKLDQELKAAGIPIDGVSSDGRIDYGPLATALHRAAAVAILNAHDSKPTLEQRIVTKGFDPVQGALILNAVHGASAPAWAKTLLQNLATKIVDATHE